MQAFPSPETLVLQRWKDPVGGDETWLALDPGGLSVFRAGRHQRHELPPFDEEAERRRLLSSPEYRLMTQAIGPVELGLYRAMLLSETEDPAAARQRWSEQGLPDALWDELNEFERRNGSPFPMNPPTGMGGGLPDPDGRGVWGSLPDPLPSLSPWVQTQGAELTYGSATFAPPELQSLLWQARQELALADAVALSPRRAGRLWLPTRWEAQRPAWEARLRPVLRPAVLPGTPEPWESKLGGVPYRPRGAPWPHIDGQPLQFMAQFDLAEANGEGHLPELPRRGLLQFFVGARPDFIYRGQAIYIPEVDRSAALDRMVPAPETFLEDLDIPEQRLALLPDHEFPSLLDPAAPMRADLSDPTTANHPGGHRLGGWPMLVELTPDSSWRLLFQYDGTNAAMAGWAAFFITEADLQAGRWERAWVAMDNF